MDKKTCTKCGVEKPLTEYHASKKSPDGLRWRCKGCVKEYQQANRDRILEQRREYYKTNHDHILERDRSYYEANRDKVVQRKRAYNQAKKDMILEWKRFYEAHNK